MKKRILSLLMALVLCFSLLPTAALAEEAGAAQEIQGAADAGDVEVPESEDGEDTGDAEVPEGGEDNGGTETPDGEAQDTGDGKAPDAEAPDSKSDTTVLTAQVSLTAEGEGHTAHCVCGGTENVNGHEHGSATTEWNAADSLPDSAGNYYLTQTVSGSWTVTGNIKLCLNGQTITGDITVGSGAKLTLTDCTGNGTVQGGVLVSGGTFELYGGTIAGGVQVGINGGIYQTGSTFTMYGGTITGNTAASGSGGGVFLVGTTNQTDPPRFTMHGGTISNNIAGASDGGGGGVYVGEKCSFTMDGGTITGNTATDGNGGGIYIHYNAGNVSISNATITNNKTTATATGYINVGLGGGIYAQKGLTVSNSTITGNEATYYGGGICGMGSITLNSTVITGNKSTKGNGGGVYASKMDSTSEGTGQPLSVSGSTQIKDNAPNNYHVNEERQLPIKVTGTLEGDAAIYVAVIEKFKPAYGGKLTIAEPASDVTLSASNFKADAGDCVTGLDETGKVYLARCAHAMNETGYTCEKCHTEFDARAGENAYYQTLNEAFSEAKGDTVTLLRDVALNANCSAAFSYDTTLDLNGKTISGVDKPISVYKKLTVKDPGADGETQALNVKFFVYSNGKLAVDDSYTGDISCVTIQDGGALERFGGKIGELVLQNSAYGYEGAGGYSLKLWKDNANACTIGKLTDNTTSKTLTVSDLLGTDYAKCELYGEKDDTWSMIDKSTKLSELTGYAAYKVQFPECEHQCSDDSNPVCSKCDKDLYTKITAKAADGTVKTAYFAADSTLENGYVEAIQTLNDWRTTGYTEPTLTLLRDTASGTELTLTGTLTLEGGKYTACNVTVAAGADVTFASGSYKGATINGTATVKNGVTFTEDASVTVNGTLNVKGGAFTGAVKFEGSSTANISGGSFTNDRAHGGVMFGSSVTGTISGGTFTYAEFHATGVKLTGGTFDEISINGGYTLADLLAEGAAYYTGNIAVSNDAVTILTNVTVKSHTHNVNDTSGVCSVCNKQMTAAVTVGGTTSWYAAFATAIEAANAADGAKTITLYQDVNGYVGGNSTTYELTRGPVTLDTGGKMAQRANLIVKGISLTVTGNGGGFNVTADGKDAELTVNDESTKLAYVTAQNGGKLSLSNGTFSGVKVKNDGSSASLSGGSYGEIAGDSGYVKPYALLAEGYAYKKTEDSKWVSNANITLKKVAVEKAPFAVEKVYPNSDTAYTGSSAIADDGSIKLTVVVTPETQAVTYQYQWELLKADGNWVNSAYFKNVNNATHTGADGMTLTITGLPIGNSYQYRVLVVGSDGYQCYSEPFTVTAKAHEHAVNNGGENVMWTPIGSEATLRNITNASGAPVYYYLTQDITLNDSSWVPVDGMVLDLNGKSITAKGAFDTITVNSGVRFTLTDCKGGGENYGAITHEMENWSTRFNGRGVMVSEGGHFTMYGGCIGPNLLEDAGAGVYVAGGATFTMLGGAIAGNWVSAAARNNGGGIWTAGTTTIGGDAEITGDNRAQAGGGVYVSGGTLTLEGGAKVTGNMAYNAHGSGIFVGTNGRLCVSGSVQVTGNTYNAIIGNVYLEPDNSKSVKPITVIGELTDASIHVSFFDETLSAIGDSNPMTIAEADTAGWIKDGSFVLDGQSTHKLYISEDGKAVELGTHPHEWEYKVSSDGTSIEAKCTKAGCTVKGGSVTISVANDTYIYDGNERPAQLTGEFKTGAATPTVTYTLLKNGNYVALPAGEAVPTNAGQYKASITVGDATTYVEYRIQQATPQAGDFDVKLPTDPTDLTYDGNKKTAEVKVKDGIVGMGDYAVEYFYYPKNEDYGWTLADTPTDVGTYVVRIEVKGTGNYAYTSERLIDEEKWVFTITPAEKWEVNVPDSWKTTTEVIEGSTFGDALYAIGGYNPINGTGVNKETLYGSISWYTDATCTKPVDKGAKFDGEAGSTVTLYWKFTLTHEYQKKNYTTDTKTGSVTFSIVAGKPQKLTIHDASGKAVTEGTENYGNRPFSLTVRNETADGGAITYASSNEGVAKIAVDKNGEITVTICGVGTTTITATAARVDGKYAQTTATYTLTVEKGEWGKAVTVAMRGYSYNGNVPTPSLFNYDSGDYSAVTYYYSTTNTNSGGKEWENITPISLEPGTYYMYAEIAETTNYKAYTTAVQEFTVYKALPTCTPPTGLTATYGQTLKDITLTNPEGNTPGTWRWTDDRQPVGDASTTPRTFTAIFTPDDKVHYEIMDDINVEVTVNKANQTDLTIVGEYSVVYGEKLTLTTTGGSGTGAVTYRIDTTSTGEAIIDANTGVLTPVKTGSVSVIATKAGDSNYNEATSAHFVLMITPATPSGEPGYTKITGSGKTLADAGLTLDGSSITVPGTVKWVADDGVTPLDDTTVVEANKRYKWLFTPTDTANYTTLTGSIELYHRSGGYYYYPTDTGTGTKPSAGTGDAGLLPYAVTAMMSYTGTAVLLRRRKRED